MTVYGRRPKSDLWLHGFCYKMERRAEAARDFLQTDSFGPGSKELPKIFD
jgi:hypothetical protein